MHRLTELESQSIFIFREAFARLKNVALLWSLGKDSNVMIWLARKAFFGRVPFPVMHVDTGKKFAEMYEFRERYSKEWQLDLIVEPCPPIEEIEKTINEFSALGLKVMITELDVDVLPGRGPQGNADVNRREQGDSTTNPYTTGLPADMQEKLARRYADIFDVYLKHRKSITRVTFWGLDDGQTWLNGFPIRGRTNHPLLFDRELKPKPAFEALIKKGQEKRPR